MTSAGDSVSDVGCQTDLSDCLSGVGAGSGADHFADCQGVSMSTSSEATI